MDKREASLAVSKVSVRSPSNATTQNTQLETQTVVTTSWAGYESGSITSCTESFLVGRSCVVVNGFETPATPTTYTSKLALPNGSFGLAEIVTWVVVTTTASISSSEILVSSTTANSISESIPASTSEVGRTASKSHSVNTGAVAAAAVGGVLGGALITALVTFFLFKQRLKRSQRIPRSSYITRTPANGHEKEIPIVPVASVRTLDFLPQQADDAEVQKKLSTVIDQFDQHVENFYMDHNVPLGTASEDDLARFETSLLPAPLAACFEAALLPSTLIKHCLAFHAFNLTMAPGNGTQSLLPPDISGTITAMYTRSLSPSASKDTLAAFSSWKSLTGYLRPDLLRYPATSKSTVEGAKLVAARFTDVFTPWANPQYSDEHRNRHLTELLNHSIHTAIWLFTQPDNFKFDWDAPVQGLRQSSVGRGGNIVVVPAVWKLTYNGTRIAGRGQRVIAPVVKPF